MFKKETPLQRAMVNKLTDAVREYLEVVEKPTGGRHRKTTLTFVGDRYRPAVIHTRFVVPKSKNDNE